MWGYRCAYVNSRLQVSIEESNHRLLKLGKYCLCFPSLPISFTWSVIKAGEGGKCTGSRLLNSSELAAWSDNSQNIPAMAAYWNPQQLDLQDDGMQLNGHAMLPSAPTELPVASTSSAISAVAGGEAAAAAAAARSAGPLKVACLACRKLKIRCNRLESTSKCTRCERFNLECRFKEHAR